MLEIGIVVIIGIIIALAFDFENGRNDAANAVSTVVATRVLSLPSAVVLSAFFNMIAAFVFSTAVAHTIGTGVVDPSAINVYVVIAGLLSSVIWIFFLSNFGIPISASHSLIGGLIGAAVAASGISVLVMDGVLKIAAFIFIAPVVGAVSAMAFSLFVFFVLRRTRPDEVQHWFKRLQLVSVSAYSLGHGTNDAQKTMGIIALLLFTGGFMETFEIPFWVVMLSHITIAVGTLAGGMTIVKTMATKITKLRPVDGFCAETSGAGVIWACSILGIPVSTTHVIAGSISGVGALKRASSVNWLVARKIVAAWLLTIPLTALGGALTYLFFRSLFSFF